MQEEVTFYSWQDNFPSSQTICVIHGLRHKDPNSQRVYSEAQTDIRFNMGMYKTSVPEVIEVLRGLIKKGGSDISESYEDYVKHVLPPEQLAAREGRRSEALKAQVVDLQGEIERLKAQLEEKASAGQPRGRKAGEATA